MRCFTANECYNNWEIITIGNKFLILLYLQVSDMLFFFINFFRTIFWVGGFHKLKKKKIELEGNGKDFEIYKFSLDKRRDYRNLLGFFLKSRLWNLIRIRILNHTVLTFNIPFLVQFNFINYFNEKYDFIEFQIFVVFNVSFYIFLCFFRSLKTYFKL